MTEEVKLTPEVSVSDKALYLIRIDGEELAFVNSVEEAKLVIDSIAAAEVKRLDDEWVKVFRRDQTDGKKVTLATQALGRVVNGAVRTAMRIDCIVVPCAKLLRGRHERMPVAPPRPKNEIPLAPTPGLGMELLEVLRKRRESIEPSSKKVRTESLKDEPKEVDESDESDDSDDSDESDESDESTQE